MTKANAVNILNKTVVRERKYALKYENPESEQKRANCRHCSLSRVLKVIFNYPYMIYN